MYFLLFHAKNKIITLPVFPIRPEMLHAKPVLVSNPDNKRHKGNQKLCVCGVDCCDMKMNKT